MALADLLQLSESRRKIGLSPERVEAVKPIIRLYIAFWREYPDIFVDFLVRGRRQEPKEGEFQFYYYLRVFLRSVMRYQYVYAVFPRACVNAPKGNNLFPWTNFFNSGNPIFNISVGNPNVSLKLKECI